MTVAKFLILFLTFIHQIGFVLPKDIPELQQEKKWTFDKYDPHRYRLPYGYDDFGFELKRTFSCHGKSYGYHADVDNNCRVFHLCVPFVYEGIEIAPLQYSYYCNNMTVFNPNLLTCTSIDLAPKCKETSTNSGDSDGIINFKFEKIIKPTRNKEVKESIHGSQIASSKQLTVDKDGVRKGRILVEVGKEAKSETNSRNAHKIQLSDSIKNTMDKETLKDYENTRHIDRKVNSLTDRLLRINGRYSQQSDDERNSNESKRGKKLGISDSNGSNVNRNDEIEPISWLEEYYFGDEEGEQTYEKVTNVGDIYSVGTFSSGYEQRSSGPKGTKTPGREIYDKDEPFERNIDRRIYALKNNDPLASQRRMNDHKRIEDGDKDVGSEELNRNVESNQDNLRDLEGGIRDGLHTATGSSGLRTEELEKYISRKKVPSNGKQEIDHIRRINSNRRIEDDYKDIVSEELNRNIESNQHSLRDLEGGIRDGLYTATGSSGLRTEELEKYISRKKVPSNGKKEIDHIRRINSNRRIEDEYKDIVSEELNRNIESNQDSLRDLESGIRDGLYTASGLRTEDLQKYISRKKVPLNGKEEIDHVRRINSNRRIEDDYKDIGSEELNRNVESNQDNLRDLEGGIRNGLHTATGSSGLRTENVQKYISRKKVPSNGKEEIHHIRRINSNRRIVDDYKNVGSEELNRNIESNQDSLRDLEGRIRDGLYTASGYSGLRTEGLQKYISRKEVPSNGKQEIDHIRRIDSNRRIQDDYKDIGSDELNRKVESNQDSLRDLEGGIRDGLYKATRSSGLRTENVDKYISRKKFPSNGNEEIDHIRRIDSNRRIQDDYKDIGSDKLNRNVESNQDSLRDLEGGIRDGLHTATGSSGLRTEDLEKYISRKKVPSNGNEEIDHIRRINSNRRIEDDYKDIGSEELNGNVKSNQDNLRDLESGIREGLYTATGSSGSRAEDLEKYISRKKVPSNGKQEIDHIRRINSNRRIEDDYKKVGSEELNRDFESNQDNLRDLESGIRDGLHRATGSSGLRTEDLEKYISRKKVPSNGKEEIHHIRRINSSRRIEDVYKNVGSEELNRDFESNQDSLRDLEGRIRDGSITASASSRLKADDLDKYVFKKKVSSNGREQIDQKQGDVFVYRAQVKKPYEEKMFEEKDVDSGLSDDSNDSSGAFELDKTHENEKSGDSGGFEQSFTRRSHLEGLDRLKSSKENDVTNIMKTGMNVELEFDRRPKVAETDPRSHLLDINIDAQRTAGKIVKDVHSGLIELAEKDIHSDVLSYPKRDHLDPYEFKEQKTDESFEGGKFNLNRWNNKHNSNNRASTGTLGTIAETISNDQKQLLDQNYGRKGMVFKGTRYAGKSHVVDGSLHSSKNIDHSDNIERNVGIGLISGENYENLGKKFIYGIDESTEMKKKQMLRKRGEDLITIGHGQTGSPKLNRSNQNEKEGLLRRTSYESEEILHNFEPEQRKFSGTITKNSPEALQRTVGSNNEANVRNRNFEEIQNTGSIRRFIDQNGSTESQGIKRDEIRRSHEGQNSKKLYGSFNVLPRKGKVVTEFVEDFPNSNSKVHEIGLATGSINPVINGPPRNAPGYLPISIKQDDGNKRKDSNGVINLPIGTTNLRILRDKVDNEDLEESQEILQTVKDDPKSSKTGVSNDTPTSYSTIAKSVPTVVSSEQDLDVLGDDFGTRNGVRSKGLLHSIVTSDSKRAKVDGSMRIKFIEDDFDPTLLFEPSGGPEKGTMIYKQKSGPTLLGNRKDLDFIRFEVKQKDPRRDETIYSTVLGDSKNKQKDGFNTKLSYNSNDASKRNSGIAKNGPTLVNDRTEQEVFMVNTRKETFGGIPHVLSTVLSPQKSRRVEGPTRTRTRTYQKFAEDSIESNGALEKERNKIQNSKSLEPTITSNDATKNDSGATKSGPTIVSYRADWNTPSHKYGIEDFQEPREVYLTVKSSPKRSETENTNRKIYFKDTNYPTMPIDDYSFIAVGDQTDFIDPTNEWGSYNLQHSRGKFMNRKVEAGRFGYKSGQSELNLRKGANIFEDTILGRIEHETGQVEKGSTKSAEIKGQRLRPLIIEPLNSQTITQRIEKTQILKVAPKRKIDMIDGNVGIFGSENGTMRDIPKDRVRDNRRYSITPKLIAINRKSESNSKGLGSSSTSTPRSDEEIDILTEVMSEEKEAEFYIRPTALLLGRSRKPDVQPIQTEHQTSSADHNLFTDGAKVGYTSRRSDPRRFDEKFLPDYERDRSLKVQPVDPDAYGVAGSSRIVTNNDNDATSFSCDRQPYGYYADVQSGCTMFHVCVPRLYDTQHTSAAQVHVQRYSFLCGPGTVFDQKTLTCTWPQLLPSCSESHKFFYIHDYFDQVSR